MTGSSPTLSPILTLRILVPFALGYFLSYLYRAVNAVIAPDLVKDTGLDASDLGLLTSAYFLTFAAFQLPLGILLDRYGPRKTEAGLLLFAALGAFIFAKADGPLGLMIGRGLIGFGVSACLMAAFKAFVQWFDSRRLPLVNGIQMASGGMGALCATIPVEWTLQVTDWRGVFLILAAATLLVAAVLFTTVPDKKTEQTDITLGEQISGMAAVFKNPIFLAVAPWTFLSQASFISLQGLWLGPWLEDVVGLDREAVAQALFLTASAMVAGFLLMGALAERLSRLGVAPMTIAAFGMAAFALTQFLLIVGPVEAGIWLWVAFGFLGTSGILPYAALTQRFPPHLAGRVNTALNLLVFVTAFAAQWGVGAIVNQWPLADGAGYEAFGYRAGFATLLALQVLGLLWFLASPGRQQLKKDQITP